MDHTAFYHLTIIAAVVVLLLNLYYSCNSLRRRNSSPPTPTPPRLPVIGHLHLVTDSLHLSLSSLSKKYGNVFSLQLGCKSFLVVSSPTAVEECFTRNDIVFANRPNSLATDCVTYGYTAFVWAPYGDLWRTVRRFSAVELFSSQSLTRSAEIRENEVQALLRALYRGIVRGWGSKLRDLTYLSSILVFNSMMQVVSGRQLVGEEDIDSEFGKEEVKRIRRIFPPTLLLGSCDFFPVLRWLGYGGVEKRLRSIHQRRDEFLGGLVDGEHHAHSLIETLLRLQATEPEFYTDELIKSFLMVMFVAGTDTSAAALERAMQLLLSHPEKLQKLREEIDEKVGQDRVLRDSDLTNLPYLRCVVNETLRLYPPTPTVLPHASSEDCTVGGHVVPAGTILVVNIWGMHRDPDLWEEPEKFIPERFQSRSEKEIGHKFLPFGMGRRGCPGSGMALRTVSLGLAALVQCFDWERVSGHDVEAKPLEAVCIARQQAAHIFSQL